MFCLPTQLPTPSLHARLEKAKRRVLPRCSIHFWCWWRHFSPTEVKVVWRNILLTEGETQLLHQLCRQVSYLGALSHGTYTCRSDISLFVLSQLVQKLLLSGERESQVLAPLSSEGLEGFSCDRHSAKTETWQRSQMETPADVLEALS